MLQHSGSQLIVDEVAAGFHDAVVQVEYQLRQTFAESRGKALSQEQFAQLLVCGDSRLAIYDARIAKPKAADAGMLQAANGMQNHAGIACCLRCIVL